MRPTVFLVVLTVALLGDGARAAELPWAFVPPRKIVPPRCRDRAVIVNPIDAFIRARLEAEGIAPSPPADRLTLLRRVTFDLTGLLPTPVEQQAFLADSSPDAYEKVVERLLASPHYGERWAQHWLDLARYAETDGFKADGLRPDAYCYRDYVIRALNADLPYDRFVRQQLAGDELEPDNPDALIATGFCRLWPDEYNAANLEQRRQEILDDVTEVTGLAFLGLTIGCARCHDHKFDPITQKDHFRLQAFFAPMLPRDLPAADARQKRAYDRQLVAWEKATAPIRKEMEALTAGKRTELRRYALEKFRPEIQQAFRTPQKQRTPYQEQIARMAEKQLVLAEKDAPRRLPPDRKKRYEELERQLAAVTPHKPAPLPVAMALTDVGPQAPPTYLLAGGDWRRPGEELTPGFPEVFRKVTADIPVVPLGHGTGRRAALARWLTRRDNPLTARVLVNRLWQHHFGQGLVATPSDFGNQGEAPTHPELLDWLATEFMEHGWSVKHLHRLMVTSATYRQTSRVDPAQARRAYAVDRDNRLLWHARRQRLEGEAIRDAMLLLSGELNVRLYGPSARPRLPERISNYAWKPDPRPEDQHRRSIYVFVKRNLHYPLFDAFDQPDLHNSCARRTQTTTAPQALLLLNSDFTRERARHWAARLLAECPDDYHLVTQAYREAWDRPPSAEEVQVSLGFLHKQAGIVRQEATGGDAHAAAIADFCHALLSANEFLYVD